MGLDDIFEEEVEEEAPKEEVPKKEEPERGEPKKEEPQREKPQKETKGMNFEEVVEKIVKHTGQGRDEILSLVKKKQDELMGFVTPEGAATLVAKELNVDLVEKPIEEKPKGEPEVKKEPEEKIIEEKPTEAVEKPSEPEEKPALKEETPLEGTELAEAKGTAKNNFMVYGQKGAGKTFLSFSFPGKIVCLSFDKKSLPIKQHSFNNDSRIRVFDAAALMNYSSPEGWTESADKTFKHLNLLIDKIASWKPDWIVIDGSEILQQICEMTMRYRNNLMCFQGISNRNLWKERRLYIRQIHNKCFNAAEKGVIYTTYTSKDEIIREGEFVTKDDVPRWIDAILYETDAVIKIRSIQEKGGRRFYATIESSKFPPFKTGRETDVTDRGVGALLETAVTEVTP